MFYVSEVCCSVPNCFQTPLQRLVYETLEILRIPFARVDTDEAITMEECTAINEKLAIKMVKTLFLCNRQRTDYYLFITTGTKPFRAKDFSTALGISRVSFAPAEQLETMLGTCVGSATIFSSLLDIENRVRIIFDRDVLSEDWYGCSDGTTTSYVKVRTADIWQTFLAYTGHVPTVIEV